MEKGGKISRKSSFEEFIDEGKSFKHIEMLDRQPLMLFRAGVILVYPQTFVTMCATMFWIWTPKMSYNSQVCFQIQLEQVQLGMG